MCGRQAAEYREGLAQMRNLQNDGESGRQNMKATTSFGGATVGSDHGVRLVVIEGAGHHLSDDIHQNEGAEALLQFLQQC